MHLYKGMLFTDQTILCNFKPLKKSDLGLPYKWFSHGHNIAVNMVNETKLLFQHFLQHKQVPGLFIYFILSAHVTDMPQFASTWLLSLIWQPEPSSSDI